MWDFRPWQSQNQMRVIVWNDFPQLSLSEVDAAIDNWRL